MSRNLVLKGKTVLLAGGAGNVGEGMTAALLDRGATVVVPSRSPEKLAALRDYVGPRQKSLVTVETDVSDEARAAKLVEDVLREQGPIELCIASLGGWWKGPDLVDIDAQTFSRVVSSTLLAHFVCARSVLSAMRARRQGTYVFIGGPGGVTFVPNSSPIIVAGTAQLTMAQAFARELRPHGVRVLQLFVAKIRTRERGRGPAPGWMTPEDIGHHIVDIHDGKVDRPELSVRSFLPPGVPPIPIPELKSGS